MINEFFIAGNEVFIKLFTTRSESIWTVIDIVDLDLVCKYNKWREMIPKFSDYTSYAQSKTINNKTVGMHRLILNLRRGDRHKTDHKNRNGLDNRRSNLKVATTSENGFNKNIQSNNTSGTTGVIWDRRDERWIATIYINGNRIELGRSRNKQKMIELREQVIDGYLP